MLARLVRFALTQRLLVAVATLMLAAAGLWAFQALPIDAYPDVSSTQVKVIMKAPGMTPEEVEARITTPIELELLGIPHKRVVRSVSKYAIADVTLDFEEGTDIYWARQQVAERLVSVARALPQALLTAVPVLVRHPVPSGARLPIGGRRVRGAARVRCSRTWCARGRLRTPTAFASTAGPGCGATTRSAGAVRRASRARVSCRARCVRGLPRSGLRACDRSCVGGTEFDRWRGCKWPRANSCPTVNVWPEKEHRVATAEVHAVKDGQETLCAVMQQTIMVMHGKAEK